VQAEDYAELVTVDPRHYIIDREIARGGMGRIMVGRDRRVGRPVAIKELLSHSDDLRARFEREARITARLQHPAIVNLLEAGAWPGGEPFYVMKLVTGESLDKAIARSTTHESRMALLPNVLATVDALAYAHNMRIIHRDLKPANVLVGEFGETVVIDWGLAKDLADVASADVAIGPYRGNSGDIAATVEGAVIGTPGYMPPEQAKGEAVDERADVYSLGAMLYHVLAGEPPYRGRTVEAILVAVVAGPPEPLEQRVPSVPPDLAAIVAKAMAYKPADRYANAKEMADDLKKFQTGQLVGAHRYSTWQLLRRWVRRHRTAVAVGAVAATLLAVFGAIGLRQIFDEQARAEQQRALAVKSRTDSEDLVRFMILDLRDKLTPLGRVDLLQDAANKTVAYYDRRGGDLAGEELNRLAGAKLNLGDVLSQQAQTQAALEQYRAALVIYTTLVAGAPLHNGWQKHRSVAYEKIGNILLAKGDTPGALVQYRAALAISEMQVTREPSNPDWQRGIVVRRRKIADVVLAQGDLPGALAELRAALALAEPAAAKDPTKAVLQADLYVTRQRIGDVLQAQGDLPAALVEFHASLATLERLAASDPKNVVWQQELPPCHARIGDVLHTQGDLPGALARYRQALALGETLAKHDPANSEWATGVAVSRERIGDILLAQKDMRGALVEYRASLQNAEAQVAQDPTNADFQRNLMASLLKVGDLMLQSRNATGSLAQFKAALTVAKVLADQDPTNADRAFEAGFVHYYIGEALLAKAQVAPALEHYRATLASTEKLLATGAENAVWQQHAAMAHERLGDALAKQRNKQAARAEYAAGLAIAKRLADKDPSNAELTPLVRSLTAKSRG
jgi:tetratricopeptide (TPR) repeat protein